MVIDFFDIWREGTHAIYIEDDGSQKAHVTIDTVAAHRGDRPWSPRIAKRRRDKHPKLPLPRIVPTGDNRTDSGSARWADGPSARIPVPLGTEAGSDPDEGDLAEE
jgi:competence protein ComEC